MIAEGITNPTDFPAIKQFIIDNKISLKNNSKLYEAIDGNFEELRFIEYFLTHHKNIANGNELAKKLLEHGKQELNFSDRHSLLSELEAFYLLHGKLSLDVYGYEPNIAGQKKKPEFSVRANNKDVYFEVKDKCSEVVQKVPKKINDLFKEIEKKHCDKYLIVVTEVENLSYQDLGQPDNLNLIEKAVQERLTTIELYKILQRSDRHSSTIKIPINKGTVIISIRRKDDKIQERPEYFTPDRIDDIRTWLFEESVSKKTGEKMIPMVKQAENKGADYLMCRIPFWRNLNASFFDYIKPLFSDIKLIKTNFAISKDNELGNLSGMIIFCSLGSLNDDYIIVSNSNVTPKIKDWLRNVPCN